MVWKHSETWTKHLRFDPCSFGSCPVTFTALQRRVDEAVWTELRAVWQYVPVRLLWRNTWERTKIIWKELWLVEVCAKMWHWMMEAKPILFWIQSGLSRLLEVVVTFFHGPYILFASSFITTDWIVLSYSYFFLCVRTSEGYDHVVCTNHHCFISQLRR